MSTTGPAPATPAFEELSRLTATLSIRESITDFAWAFGLACGAFVSGGLAVKLFRDSVRTPKVAYVLLVASLAMAGVTALRLWVGRRRFAAELRDFERMQALRRELGLDRPRLPSP